MATIKKAVPKAQMPSTTMAGMGKTKRAPSKRNDIVKKIMKKGLVSVSLDKDQLFCIILVT
jgi:hypothetical protein